MTRPGGLAKRLLITQVGVIAISAIAMIVVGILITPSLFTHHLSMAGEPDPLVQEHALQALASTVAVAGSVALVVALAAAAISSWFLVIRIARPLDQLAAAAQEIEAGTFPARVSTTTSQDEVAVLVTAFNDMAGQLERTEAFRLRLLSDLSHELRTPLATLEAYIDGFEDLVLAVDAENLAVMRGQVMRMRRLAGDLGVITAAGEHALDLVLARRDVAGLLSAACASASPRYDAKGIRLNFTVPVIPLYVDCDEERMQQVLANLLENSLRHTPAGGQVTLSARRDHDVVLIEVQDSGEGIPPDKLEAVFERFTRLDESRATSDGSGSGLGLTIARDIIRGHSGELTAQSTGSGQGTTMTVRLPAAVNPSGARASGSSEARAGDASQ